MNALRHQHNRILVATAALFLFVTPIAAAERVRVATLYIGSSMLPLWVAKEEGDFARRGLDVELIWLQSTLSTYALIAGEVDLIFGTPQETLLAVTGNAPSALITVGSWETNSKHWLVVSNTIQLPKDLIGKTLATSRPKAADGTSGCDLRRHGNPDLRMEGCVGVFMRDRRVRGRGPSPR